MKGHNFPIFPVLIMTAMGILAYWFYKNIEFEEIELPVAQKDIARNNKVLAASRLLEREGFSFSIAEDRRVFSELDVNYTDVLWLANLNELSSAEEVDQILNWVESGGMLLTSPAYTAAFDASTASGQFLDKIGITEFSERALERLLDDPDFIERYDEESDEFRFNLEPSLTGHTTIPVTIDTNDYPYFRNALFGGKNDNVIIDTPYIVHKGIGDGFVTVYANQYMFQNHLIDSYEHSYLLLWLTEPTKIKNLTIVSQPKEKPGLFKVLWNRFTVSLLILGAVLIGFLRWASSRLGPVEHELPPIQNNLMAHLEARGEYWYRHNYTDKMVGNVQEAALDNLLKDRGLSSKDQAVSQSERETSIKHASALLKCSPVTAEKALYGDVSKDSAILTASRALQKINHRKPFKPSE